MSLKRTLLLMGGVIGLLVCSSQTQAAPLLVGGSDNRIDFTNVENLYAPTAPGVATYVSGITAPAVGDFLVGAFNITFNNANGWSSNTTPGFRDTYYGIFVQKIVAIGPGPGGLTISLAAPTVGDATVFAGGALGDVSAFNVAPFLNYAANESTYISHQGGAEPLYATTGVTMASTLARATSGTPYLSLALNPPVASSPTPTPPSTVDYGFSTGTFPPGLFNARGFLGYDIGTVNNTGYSLFTRITDRNINFPLGGPLVDVYLESQLNYNANGQFNFNSPPTSVWDFQSSDPTNLHPAAPEPASVIVMTLGLGFVAGRRLVRARRQKLAKA